MTPLQAYDAAVRHILEWAVLQVTGISAYKRNQTSTPETSP